MSRRLRVRRSFLHDRRASSGRPSSPQTGAREHGSQDNVPLRDRERRSRENALTHQPHSVNIPRSFPNGRPTQRSVLPNERCSRQGYLDARFARNY